MYWQRVVDNNGEPSFIDLERASRIGVGFHKVGGRDRPEWLVSIDVERYGVSVRYYLDQGHHTDQTDAWKHAENLAYNANRGGATPIPRTRRPILNTTDDGEF